MHAAGEAREGGWEIRAKSSRGLLWPGFGRFGQIAGRCLPCCCLGVKMVRLLDHDRSYRALRKFGMKVLWRRDAYGFAGMPGGEGGGID